MKTTAQIFLSYAREDEKKVEDLYQKLSDTGFKPWMDKKDILPGEKWKVAIQRAIQSSHFFLVCLSAKSIEKRGWVQREIKWALDILQGMLDSDIYLIPVRLEDCEVPESLGDFQWVNPLEEDGWTQLVKAIHVGMERRKATQVEGKRQAEVIKLTPEKGSEQLVAASRAEAVGFLDRLAKLVPIWQRVLVRARGAAISRTILLGAAIIGAVFLFSRRETLPPIAIVVRTPTPAVAPLTNTPVPTMPTPTPPTATPVPPTATKTPTQTPVPPTVTATDTPSPTATSPPTTTDTPSPPPPTEVPATAVPQPDGGPIALTIYLRRTETDFTALSDDKVNAGIIYEEGQFVYGEAAVQIGDTIYHFDKPEVGPGEPEQLPDPWRVEFEFAPELVARTGNQAGFNAKKAQFWVGTLDGGSAIGEDTPYSLTMKLYEGNELRESIQVFFAVADAPEGGGGGEEGGGGGGKPPPPP